MIRLTATAVGLTAAAEGDETPRREISGVAVPYGVPAVTADGTKVVFEPGSLTDEGRAPKLIRNHDLADVIGLVTERVNTDEGMMFTARIAETAAGSDTLELLKMGALDAVSVGANPIDADIDQDGTLIVKSAEWVELSIVAAPAFDAARISRVAAQAPENPEDKPVSDTPVPSPADPGPETIPATPVWAEARRPFRMPSPAEWVAAWKAGGADFRELNAAVMAAAPRLPIQAAAGDVTTAEADGILPEPILGPIFDAVNQSRPVVSALGTRAMPAAGKVFIRPKIKTRTLVEEQSAELGSLSTRSFETEDVQITKRTYGGRVLLSEQVIDWSEPDMLNAVLADLAREYAVATEARVVGTVGSSGVIRDAMGTGQGEQATNFTAADKVISAFYSAAGKIAADTGYLPNVLACHPLMWTKIGQLTDQNLRPLFPTIAPSNAPGTSSLDAYTSNVLGLSLVVSKEMAGAGFFGSKNANEVFVMFNSAGIELYETQKGSISVQVPDKLALNLAFRGYFEGVVMAKEHFKVIYTGAL